MRRSHRQLMRPRLPYLVEAWIVSAQSPSPRHFQMSLLDRPLLGGPVPFAPRGFYIPQCLLVSVPAYAVCQALLDCAEMQRRELSRKPLPRRRHLSAHHRRMMGETSVCKAVDGVG